MWRLPSNSLALYRRLLAWICKFYYIVNLIWKRKILKYIFLALRRAWKHNWAHWAYFQPERLSGEKKIARWILKPFEHNLLWIFLGDLPKPWRMRVLQPRNGCKLFHIVQLSIWSARSNCPNSIWPAMPMLFVIDHVFQHEGHNGECWLHYNCDYWVDHEWDKKSWWVKKTLKFRFPWFDHEWGKTIKSILFPFLF